MNCAHLQGSHIDSIRVSYNYLETWVMNMHLLPVNIPLCITHVLRRGGNAVGVAWTVGLGLISFVSGASVTAAGLKPKLEIRGAVDRLEWRRGRRHGQRCRDHGKTRFHGRTGGHQRTRSCRRMKGHGRARGHGGTRGWVELEIMHADKLNTIVKNLPSQIKLIEKGED